MAVSQSLTLTQSSQSVAGNYSKVRILWKSTQTGDSRNGYTRTAKYYVSINGGAETEYSVTYTLPKGTTTTIADATITVDHKTDGTGTVRVRTWMDTDISAGVITQNKTLTLTTIPRASSVSAAKGTLGTEQTLTVARNSSSFTHTITYKCGSASGTICDKSNSTSVKWKPPLSLAAQNTTGGSVSITLTITTYTGSTQVGDAKTSTFTATIPDSVKPTASLALSDPTGIFGIYGGYVQGKSKLAVELTGAGDQGSTIKSYQIKVGGATYSGSSKTVDLPYAESLEVIGTVTDSRARPGSDSKTVSVLPYTAPRVNSLAVTRCAANGTPQADGTFAKATFSAVVTPLNNLNSASYRIEYREAGTSSWNSVKADTATGQYVPSGVAVVFAAAADSAFEVRVAVQDDFGTVYTSLRTLPVAFALLQGDTTGTGLAVGQMATEPNVFAVGLPTKIRPGEVPYAMDITGDVRAKNYHGYVYGLGKAQSQIPEGANLNDYLDFGVYAVASNTIAASLANSPSVYAGTLIVSSGNGSGVNSGYYVYILQTYRTFNGDYEFTRCVYTDNTGEFKYLNWMCKSSPWWASLGLSDKVSTASSNYGRAGQGCFYRVVNENHVYVSFNCALTYSGATLQINSAALPEKYRPARSVYSLCAAGGRTVARVCVSSSGNVYVEWVQDLSATGATTSFTLGWIDGYLDFWVA